MNKQSIVICSYKLKNDNLDKFVVQMKKHFKVLNELDLVSNYPHTIMSGKNRIVIEIFRQPLMSDYRQRYGIELVCNLIMA